MPAISVILQGDGAWPDVIGKEVIHLGNNAPPIQVAALPGGMQSGLPSVTIRIDLPDGKVVLAETSLKLFLFAADALRAKFGDPNKESAYPSVPSTGKLS